MTKKEVLELFQTILQESSVSIGNVNPSGYGSWSRDVVDVGRSLWLFKKN